MKEKKCCTVDVAETEKGLRLDITGARIKECLSSLVSCCCSKGDEAKPSEQERPPESRAIGGQRIPDKGKERPAGRERDGDPLLVGRGGGSGEAEQGQCGEGEPPEAQGREEQARPYDERPHLAPPAPKGDGARGKGPSLGAAKRVRDVGRQHRRAARREEGNHPGPEGEGRDERQVGRRDDGHGGDPAHEAVASGLTFAPRGGALEPYWLILRY